MTQSLGTTHPVSNNPVITGTPIAATAIPLLHSERLTLRAHQLTDLDPASAMWGNPNVVRHIGGAPRSRAEVWTTIQRSFGCWHLLGFGFWVITDRTTGEFFGEIGFLEGLRDITPSHIGTPEAGWCLTETAWGKGYASEALALVVAWADEQLSSQETICIIDTDNLASARVANKNGYIFKGPAEFAGTTLGIYTRQRQLSG